MKTPILRHRTPSALLGTLALSCASPAREARESFDYPEPGGSHLKRLFDASDRRLAYREDRAGGFSTWTREARPALQSMLGLDRIATSAGGHRPHAELETRVDCGEYFRQKGAIETEPGIRIPFWLLTPKRPGPWPLGLFPHGHDSRGHDTTAGVYADEAHAKKSLAEDRDVAVQAVKRGFIAIAPATRGISTHIVPDLQGRHGERECRSHLVHCLLAGRTAVGERVWDLQRILDWAITLPGTDARNVLMMGNSGGGMVTMFAAACDERITLAVPSCSFAPTASASGYVFHCDCNIVPGLMDIGGLTGVVGLTAPRQVLAVNGRKDTLFSQTEIERGVAHARTHFAGAGVPDHFQHRWGPEGHRFYQDLMWPYVLTTLQRPVSP